MTPGSAALLLLAWLGQAVLWQAIANRLNATGLPRHLIKAVTLACHAAQLVLPAAALAFVVIGRVLTGRFPWQRPAARAAVHSSGSSPQ